MSLDSDFGLLISEFCLSRGDTMGNAAEVFKRGYKERVQGYLLYF
jgi:hypothetical protein